MPRLMLLLGAAGLGLLPSAALADGTSKSYSDWRIDGSTAELKVSFAPHDFATAMPDLDVDRDLKIDSKELEPGRTRIGEMVVKETELSAARSKAEVKSPCRAGSPKVIAVGEPLQEVQVQLTYRCPVRIGALELSTHYLPSLEPPHVGVATITTPDTTAQHVFTRASPVFAMELRPATLAAELKDAFIRGTRPDSMLALALILLVATVPLPLKRALGAFVVFAVVYALLAGWWASGVLPERIAFALGALMPAAAAFVALRVIALRIPLRRSA